MKAFISVLLFLILIISPLSSLAVEVVVGGNTSGFSTPPGTIGSCNYSDPTSYFDCLYKFLFLMVGLSAFGAIVYGGTQYVFAAGNPSQIGTAKQWIYNGIFGLLLAGASYLILNTINSDLVKSFNLNLSNY
ncbi:MAG: hypothetical protein A3I44_00855 [Candidatus Sungbacteria bacterium RIFCSPLOWO2_02_FULL_51_17]|uniref:Uncharacterized protein n=1 Tax=Candidatus Sungbacteria bacterium RIFCSPHIGHO2_02_FULL_51_29 TaxID=1802273 RepID=A0A1G2KUQ0_9BACT|nr:MAG: hypothetical protein A2676_05740 [Candidatus Sungbacteria bacterium RIFCSPHIGHO2_01_FULL_51_22]OHA03187.1 MAG: hypothetical protein A3C16_01860 [Candidatus Sungbacteria bacterium RIFCSPHIGHO2_02_FULL_51_29]OHA07888.1 MAG: hypothetical protein A3B29_01380 [Candidatus Sungbacteria bacterium RIFCSPLOWO2_01_FULL_51_34]OHA10670.1 MAG: hypothetical protein A3I44_00855 [Candidatus Sungbacteria bacterium RIFCSPLOWO2_02_FULL_51_17]